MPPACQTQSDYEAFKSWGFTWGTFTCIVLRMLTGNVPTLDWIHLEPQVWQRIIQLNTSVRLLLDHPRAGERVSSPEHHLKKHNRTLVSKGMPLNKHINWEKQSTCHTLTNTRRDKDAKNFLIEWNPMGNNRHTCTLYYSWFSDCFQWLMSIRDAFLVNRLHWNRIKTMTSIRILTVGCSRAIALLPGIKIKSRLLPHYIQSVTPDLHSEPERV